MQMFTQAGWPRTLIAAGAWGAHAGVSLTRSDPASPCTRTAEISWMSRSARLRTYRRRHGIGLFMADRQASTNGIVDCICYVADIVGRDHVAIGLDYMTTPLESLNEQNALFWPASEGYGQGGPARCGEPAQIPEVSETLLVRGWPDGDVRKLLGENLLRVATAVWK
jgi:microsomal dipeptidase-like Zn-dependent dipeptidase